MNYEKRIELAEKLIMELGLSRDPWKSFDIKTALLDAYSAGVMDGIDQLADRMNVNKVKS